MGRRLVSIISPFRSLVFQLHLFIMSAEIGVLHPAVNVLRLKGSNSCGGRFSSGQPYYAAALYLRLLSTDHQAHHACITEQLFVGKQRAAMSLCL